MLNTLRSVRVELLVSKCVIFHSQDPLSYFFFPPSTKIEARFMEQGVAEVEISYYQTFSVILYGGHWHIYRDQIPHSLIAF